MTERGRCCGAWSSALVAMALVGLAAGWMALRAPASPRVERSETLLVVEYGTRSYHFDACWRVEKAWTRERPGARWVPAPLSSPWVAGLREALLRHLRVKSLGEIPREAEDLRRALQSLGYL